jgi:hypothetical protein
MWIHPYQYKSNLFGFFCSRIESANRIFWKLPNQIKTNPWIRETNPQVHNSLIQFPQPLNLFVPPFYFFQKRIFLNFMSVSKLQRFKTYVSYFNLGKLRIVKVWPVSRLQIWAKPGSKLELITEVVFDRKGRNWGRHSQALLCDSRLCRRCCIWKQTNE